MDPSNTSTASKEPPREPSRFGVLGGRMLRVAVRTAQGMFSGVPGTDRKKRIPDDEEGLNLDMAYVTNDIIVSAPPTQSLFKLAHNSDKDMVAFLKRFGPSLVVDLSGHYEGNAFESLACFAFPDQPTPPFQLLWTTVSTISNHLNGPKSLNASTVSLSSSPSSRPVVCVFCEGGTEGRSALVVCCYLLYEELFGDPSCALNYYRQKRGFTELSPSQGRYLFYFQQLLSASRTIEPPLKIPVMLHKIVLNRLPIAVARRPHLELEIYHYRSVYANGDAFSRRAKAILRPVFTTGSPGVMSNKSMQNSVGDADNCSVVIPVSAVLLDDFVITMWSQNEFRRRETVFSVILHTSFLLDDDEHTPVVLPSSDLDTPNQSLLRGMTVDLHISKVDEEALVPTTQVDGSIVVVGHPGEPLQAASPKPWRGISQKGPSHPPQRMAGSQSWVPPAPPLSPGRRSVCSFGASTLAAVRSEDLLSSTESPVPNAPQPSVSPPSSPSPGSSPSNSPRAAGGTSASSATGTSEALVATMTATVSAATAATAVAAATNADAAPLEHDDAQTVASAVESRLFHSCISSEVSR